MAGDGALSRLESRLGHKFRDRLILERALTHSSYAHEKNRPQDNEALEFLGDALLGFLVAESLLRRFPEMDEGGLSKCKAYLVSRPGLAAVARDLDLAPHLKLGKAADKETGRSEGTLLADALEAILAAVHIDGGDAAARACVERLFGARLSALDRDEVERKDHKTVLQEQLQAAGRSTPRYRVGATQGPAHRPTFQIDLLVDGEVVSQGQGGSKKEAEQEAARLALKILRRPAKASRRG